MRKFTKLITAVAAAATLAGLAAGGTAGIAKADPPKGVLPRAYDVVGVGSNTTQYILDQLSVDYNKTIPASKHTAAHPYLYSWDALPPGVSVAPVPDRYTITPKAGCPGAEHRPNGSGDGLNSLKTSPKSSSGTECLDFGRSSSGRSASSPPDAPGGMQYVALARDAVTWAVRGAAFGGSNAPSSLTIPQLQSIFTCTDTNWSQVGGKAGAIKVYLPQPGSGTLSFWEKAMGITTLGSCVSQAPEENEGTFAGFNDPNAVFIFSIGAYIAQKYHSPACGKAPAKGQNAFGCNTIGRLVLGPVKVGTTVIPPTTSAKVPTTNTKFPGLLDRTLYDIIRYAATKDHIPANLEPIFGRTGYLCTNATAKTDIANYGFINFLGCGIGS